MSNVRLCINGKMMTKEEYLKHYHRQQRFHLGMIVGGVLLFLGSLLLLQW